MQCAKKQSDALLLCRSFAELAFDKDGELVKRVVSALADSQNFADYLQRNKEISATTLLRVLRSLERLCEELGCLYQQVGFYFMVLQRTFALQYYYCASNFRFLQLNS